MSQVLNPQAILVYREFQVNNTKKLLQNLLHAPNEFLHHIFRSVTSHSDRHRVFHLTLIPLGSQAYTTVIRTTFGLNIVSDDDEIIPLFDETLKRMVAEGAPGACPVDLFPARESLERSGL